MRYVRNPSKLAAEQGHGHEVMDRPQKPSSTTLSCGFDKRLVTKGSDGQEQCFEEGRAQARYYHLVDSTTAFNLLAVVSKQGDDSTMDVSMGDLSMNDDSEDCKPAAYSRRSSKKTPVPKALFSGDVSMDSFNMNNISTASSTVNESHAVGVPMTKEEETINTKLAMKELSMMFSSPALGLNDLEPALEEDEDTATFSLVAGLVDEHAANNSILATSTQDENDGPRNPDARDSDMPDFHENALRMLEGDQDDRGVGDHRVEPPRAAAGFSIYCDDDDDDTTGSAPSGFQIYQDNRESMGDTATFSLFGEALKLAPAAASSAGGFQIFQDDDKRSSSGGDTATFSVLGGALKAPPAASFQIHEDDGEKRHSGGDTATFSVFGDAMKTLDVSADGGKPGFSIYMDDKSVQDTKVSVRVVPCLNLVFHHLTDHIVSLKKDW